VASLILLYSSSCNLQLATFQLEEFEINPFIIGAVQIEIILKITMAAEKTRNNVYDIII